MAFFILLNLFLHSIFVSMYIQTIVQGSLDAYHGLSNTFQAKVTQNAHVSKIEQWTFSTSGVQLFVVLQTDWFLLPVAATLGQ